VLERAGALTEDSRRVIAVSIPDWSVTPYAQGHDRTAVAADIDRFNAAARRVAGGQGAGWIEITASSRLAAGDRSLLADDGLHPSAAMYRLWSETLIVAIRRTIG
jgi:lysophospholipase L1-like esterase